MVEIIKLSKFTGSTNTNFLHARLGSSCSFIWRSIWATKGTLEKGLLWKVDKGLNISINQDTWIPDYIIDQFC
ncbi:zf-RVT domain-containing protein [Gossypium australe]|uniref:Zf-RVT domain-containing protein n=1 Tax=Gossypium australe TaxID=47621 RepID=A0A5B6WKV3_9ROSI|nr:zf-RVT domain-containing protein [Gossypium australe]